MASRQIRVLHVLGKLDRGGAETWIMHVLRAIDRERFRMDVAVHEPGEGHYDEEARGLGAQIFRYKRPDQPWIAASDLWRILRGGGPYDVVHSHVHHYSGLVVAVAAAARVPIRIAHSHVDTRAVDRAAKLARRAYVAGMGRLIRAFATDAIGCSAPATAALFGADWRTQPGRRVLPYFLDLSSFRRLADRDDARRELGLLGDDFVVGHVGRFQPVKNHAFLVEIAEELMRRDPRAKLLLVGDGPLRCTIEEDVRRRGLAHKVIFTLVREDVPRLMAAMDAFVLPSLYEGLPLVAIEAQAAGLPVVASENVTREVVLTERVRFLPLDCAAAWAESILQTRDLPAPSPESLRRVQQGPFSLASGLSVLTDLYAQRA